MPAPYGVTETGFSRKRLDEILEEFNQGVKNVFGEATNLEPQSIHGQFNGLMSYAHSIFWEMCEQIYLSVDPTSAFGDRLDQLLELFGLPPRAAATYSGLTLTITGTVGQIIQQGTAFSSSTQAVTLYTENTVIIGTNGSTTVTASPYVEGALTVLVSSVDTVDDIFDPPITVNNTEQAIVGVEIRPAETDEQIRQRLVGRRNGIAVSNAVIQLGDRLRGLPGVVESVLYSNDNDQLDKRGIPPHTYALVIDGGEDAEIAHTLWSKRTGGIGSFGSTVFELSDNQGICHPVRFSRPKDVIALLDIEVRYVDSRCGCQPHDLVGLKQLLIDLLEERRQDCSGFGIGQPLIRSRLYAAFAEVSGLEITNLRLAKHYYRFSFCSDAVDAEWDAAGFCKGQWTGDYDWTLESIAMAWNEKPVFLEQGITLTVLDKFDNTVATDCWKK